MPAHLIGDIPRQSTKQERQAKASLECKIQLVCTIPQARSTTTNSLAKKIIPGEATTYADKLALIARAVTPIEHALRAAVVINAATA
jgi:hypothetical protein